MSTLSRLLALALALSPVFALQVSPGSICADVCLDSPNADPQDPESSNTNTKDIICSDGDYLTTGIGAKYKACVNCLMTSESVDETTSESDVAWFLYNLRYSVDVCMYGFGDSEKVSSPCDIDTACLPLRVALLEDELSTENSTAYGYCDADNGAFSKKNIAGCVGCLQVGSKQKYLANFVTALEAGCEQRPEPGILIGLDGDLFSSAAVKIAAAPTPKDASEDSDPTGMTIGTIVGISVGGALLFLGGIGLLVVYFRRKRSLEDEKNEPGIAPPHSAAGSYNSYIPEHKRSSSFRSDLEMRPGMQHGAHTHAHSNSYSSNPDYFNKLEEAYYGGMTSPPRAGNKYPYDPHSHINLNPATALATHPAYVPSAMSRSSSTPSPIPLPAQESAPTHHITTTTSSSPALVPAQAPPPSSSIPGRRAPVPSPLHNVAHTRENSYALKQYLSSPEATPRTVPLVPTTTTTTTTTITSGYTSPLQNQQQQHQSQLSNRLTYSATNTTAPSLTSIIPPPPPGPPPAKGSSSLSSLIPRLTLPSVPRIKVPKKYPPPHIVIQDPTPIEVTDASYPPDLRNAMNGGGSHQE